MSVIPLPVMLWCWGRRGSALRYTVDLARALAADPTFAVHLSMSRQSEFFAEAQGLGLPGFHIDTYASAAGFVCGLFRLPAIRRSFAAYIRRHAIAVVDDTMSHLWHPAAVGAVRAGGAALVMTVHDAEPHPGEDRPGRDWLLRHEVGAADALICLTRHVRDRACIRFAKDPTRTSIVPHGVFAYGTRRQRQAPAGRPWRLLFLGRIMPYKGPALMTAAFRELKRRGLPVELHVAGPGDPTLLGDYADLVDMRVEARWLGEHELGAIVDAADLIVCPYTEASQSGVVPTGYGAGLPAVVTPVGGLAEQVDDRRTGLVASAANPMAVADAITQLITRPGLYESCSRGALDQANGDLSWASVARGVGEALRKASEARACAG